MHPIKRKAALLSAAFLLSVLLAGCGGGGGDQSAGDSGGGGQQGGQQQSKKQARETKIAIGNVVRVNEERRRMIVRPSQEVEGPEQVALKVRKNAEITLGGRKAEMSDIAQGQQAQAEYVVKNEVNRAVSVQLFKAGGQTSGGEGTSN